MDATFWKRNWSPDAHHSVQECIEEGLELGAKTLYLCLLYTSGRILLVAVEASLDTVPAVTASEAAELLGVSRARVSQMLKSGLLMGFRKGRDSFITRYSVDARLREKPKAGRPKKAASKPKPKAAEAR